jgi:3-oxoacyl-[acyl-carrier protein] reductase
MPDTTGGSDLASMAAIFRPGLLDGQVALVTGGGTGIGLGISQLLAELGAHVVMASRKPANLEAARADIASRGGKVSAVQLDVRDPEQVKAAVDGVAQQLGRIDVLVNNAGISKDNLLMRMTNEQWEQVIQVNLNSVFYMTKQVIRPMMKARSGVIINMSSIIGEIGNAGQASYAASKAGVIGFTKSVAKELGSRNIRCNAIAPGFIETDMTSYLKDGEGAEKYKSNIPLGKFGAASDVANVVVFLASDMGSYVTGQTISVCGGLNI